MALKKQLTFVAIVAVVAFLTSFLLAMITAAAATPPTVSPAFIGLIFGVVAGSVYMGLSTNRKMVIADDAARARALQGAPADSAQLIVLREGFYGKAAGVDVSVDGEVRTQLKSPRFAALDLTPGRHEVAAQVQGRKAAPVTVELVAGETRVLRLKVGMGKPTFIPEADVAAIRTSLARVPMVAS
jgi:hypothetical protein